MNTKSLQWKNSHIEKKKEEKKRKKKKKEEKIKTT